MSNHGHTLKGIEIEALPDLARRVRYSPAELARHLHVSRRHLHHCFRQLFGISPQALLDELRFLKAARLLGDGGLLVKEVASELFFYSEAHFCRRFKKFYGCTPIEFVQRRRIKRGHNVSSRPGRKIPLGEEKHRHILKKRITSSRDGRKMQ